MTDTLVPVFDLGGVFVDWNPMYLFGKLFDSEEVDEALMVEVADLMAAMFEEAAAEGRPELDEVQDDVSYDLLDALAQEKDPRAARMVELMRERGWDGWIRLERVDDTHS